ncbi:MAG: lipid A 3-O-deacylase [Candidatus Pseudothioglobus sp.]|jgi:lipid A 3-O-deacylase
MVKRLSMSALLALVLALPTTTAGASKDQTTDWTLNLYLENDLFSNTDEGYTNGVRASWVSPDVTDYLDDETLPGWIRSINQRLTFFHKTREGLQRNVTFSLGQTLYTPRDLERTDLIEDDRPYAAWLFVSLGYQTRTDLQLDTLETRFGVVGPAALGQQAQDLVHDLRGFKKFQGWDNQLANEPGVMFIWEHKRKMRPVYYDNSRFGFDVIGHSGIALGNVATYVNFGAEVRLGWSIPDDFGTAALRPGGDNSAPYSVWDPSRKGRRQWGVHAFASVDTQLVGRDIFLDGNSFTDSHSVNKKYIVAEGALGISFIYGGTKISYATIFRSKEYDLQPNYHSYGSIAFSYTF